MIQSQNSKKKQIISILQLKRHIKQDQLARTVCEKLSTINQINLADIQILCSSNSPHWVTIMIPHIQSMKMLSKEEVSRIIKRAIAAAAIYPVALDILSRDFSQLYPLKQVVIQLIYSLSFGSPEANYNMSSIVNRWSLNSQMFSQHPFMKQIQNLQKKIGLNQQYQQYRIQMQYLQNQGLQSPEILKGSYNSQQKWNKFQELCQYFKKADFLLQKYQLKQ